MVHTLENNSNSVNATDNNDNKDFEVEKYLMFRAFAELLGYEFHRARVGNTEGISFIIHTNEKARHNRPHLHAQYQGKEVVVALDSYEIIKGDIKQKNNTAVQFVKENINYLRKKWNQLSNGIKISESDFYNS